MRCFRIIVIFLLFSPLNANPQTADYTIYPHLVSSTPANGDNLAVSGFELWGSDLFAVCNSESDLLVFEVAGENLDPLGSFDATGQVRDLEIRDTLAYLATSGGLSVVSLAVPWSPTLAGELFLPGSGAHQLEVSPTHAYVACGDQGLAIVDITVPGLIYVVSWYGSDIGSVSLDGDRLAVDNNGRLEILDVSNPAAPGLLGFGDSPVELTYHGVALQGDVAYAMSDKQVDRWTLTDPDIPVLDGLPLGGLYFQNSFPNWASSGLRVRGTDLQVIGSRYLGIFDFASGTLLRESSQFGEAMDVDLSAGLLVSAETDQIHVFRDGSHSHPPHAGSLNLADVMYPEGVMMGGILYGESKSQDYTLTAVDLDNGGAHLWDEIISTNYLQFHEMAHHGSLLAVVISPPYNFLFYTVSKEGAAVRGGFHLPSYDGRASNVTRSIAFLDENHLLILDRIPESYNWDPSTLHLVDVSDPDQPYLLDSLELEINVNHGSIWTSGSLVLAGRDNIEIIDATIPGNLQSLGTLDVGSGKNFTQPGSFHSLQPLPGGNLLKTWDLSDPLFPVLTGELPVPAYSDFVRSGNFAYQTRTGLILDLTDPTRPVPAGNISLAVRDVAPDSPLLASDTYLFKGLSGDQHCFYYPLQGGTTGVSHAPGDLPRQGPRLALRANPNPFNPRVTLHFELPEAAETRVEFFDLRGRRVAAMETVWRSQGTHTVTWTGLDSEGRALPSGVYMARVMADNRSATMKLVLAR